MHVDECKLLLPLALTLRLSALSLSLGLLSPVTIRGHLIAD